MEGNSGDAESAFKKQFILEEEAAEDTYNMLEQLGAPYDQWANALKFAAEACESEGGVNGTFFPDIPMYPSMPM